ncbi:MAG: hypothetical protein OEM82_09770, partial [Acidobacteriota bacterium]|nr:hypothetical protein [Acidobacteriota bacterium]
MKQLLFLMLVISCVCTAHGQRAATTSARNADSTAAQRLPIKRVVLYSNGVAYVERRGLVTGDASIDLSFKQSQVDDV